MRIVALFALLGGATAALAAPLGVDAPITAHAVLQRGKSVPVRGEAVPGSTVRVTFDGVEQVARADASGHWRVDLPPHDAGGPYTLRVRSDDQAFSLEDVLVGDVWLCSGQSNMEFTLRHATNSDAEVGGATNPRLRLLTVPRQSSPTPRESFSQPASWQPSTPLSAGDFSAACYLMGRELQAHETVPIGLINASWGGSVIEDWISHPALATLPRYRPSLDLLARYAADPDGTRASWGQEARAWLGKAADAPAAAAWRSVASSTPWETWGDPGLAFFDGVGYYRTHVSLTPKQAGKATLAIGAVDDIDVTRVNGKMVGADQPWDKPRVYALPAGVLKAGDNVIDVAAIDTGGGGGMWGDAPRKLTLADGTEIPLTKWTFAKGPALAQLGMAPSQPWVGGSGRTTLFNGMIAPLHDYPLTGFAWYQGEANVADARGYAELMPLLISDWRARFGAKPFAMVQLANFGPMISQPTNDSWAQLRDVQRRVADADPQVGMASALDVGQFGDIHPTNKQAVGHRLALAAREIALDEAVESRGPSPLSVERGGAGIVVRFAHGPLKLVAGGEALGFELCDAGGNCRFVPGRLAGDTIVLPGDANAREVRYLWQASPLVNLYNSSDLPATGFAMPIK
uniref:sialate O-acetylesterase n=1 Tax=Altererythrobacter segetis TaxID=1104773 RepID=UPI00140B208B|nr:sialate O-acetylesterase [Altererythrobacter segetis]